MATITNKLCDIIFYEKDYILELKIRNSLDGFEVSGANLRDVLLQLISFCELYKPTKLMVNTLLGGVLFSNELRQWMHAEIYPELLKVGIKKRAYVVPYKAIFSKISMKQTIDGEPNQASNQIEIKFFHEYSLAYDWLAS